VEEEAFATRCGRDTGGPRPSGPATADISRRPDSEGVTHGDLGQGFRTQGPTSAGPSGAMVFAHGGSEAISIEMRMLKARVSGLKGQV
jgi:hypothetical protein